MREFLDFVAQYWSSLVSVLLTGLGYFLIFLYKISTKNLNLRLKTTFAENTQSVMEANSLFEKRIEYDLREARSEYIKAVKLCEDYQKRVEHLEKTFKDFLDGGEEDGGSQVSKD